VAGAAFGFEHANDLSGGMVAEKLAERFFVVGDAMFFDEGNEIGWGITRKGGFGEVWVGGEKIFRLAMDVREVAAPASGDEDFLAYFFGAFEQKDTVVAFAGFDGAEEAGCAGTQDDCVEIGQEMPFVKMKSASEGPCCCPG
jgi:hypothetical protein